MELEARTLPSSRLGDRARLLAALQRLEALPVVNGEAKFNENHNHGAGRLYVNGGTRGRARVQQLEGVEQDLNKIGTWGRVPNKTGCERKCS